MFWQTKDYPSRILVERCASHQCSQALVSITFYCSEVHVQICQVSQPSSMKHGDNMVLCCQNHIGLHTDVEGGGPRVVVSTAAFHARFRGSVPGLGGLKQTKMFLPHPRVKVSIVGGLHDREVACSASDRQGLNFESCVWRTVSS